MKATTLADVAARTGLSARTISRVVRGEPGISEATRTRVAAVVAELGYRPNMAARSLVSGTSTLIGLIVPDLTNPYFPSFAVGVQSACRARGEHVVLAQTGDDPVEQGELIESMAAHGVAGIIAFPVDGTDQQFRAAIDAGMSIVTVNARITHPQLGQVVSRFADGAAEVVDHLVGIGHRRIAMLANREEIGGKRQVGFLAALAAHGLTPSAVVEALTPTVDHGFQAALDLFEQAPDTTAVFAYNDLLAVGTMRACFELGRRVPTDCSVVGFDDIDLASALTPSLSTVRVDRTEAGRAAVHLLGRMIAGIDGPMLVEPASHLIIRESSGPPSDAANVSAELREGSPVPNRRNGDRA